MKNYFKRVKIYAVAHELFLVLQYINILYTRNSMIYLTVDICSISFYRENNYVGRLLSFIRSKILLSSCWNSPVHIHIENIFLFALINTFFLKIRLKFSLSLRFKNEIIFK